MNHINFAITNNHIVLTDKPIPKLDDAAYVSSEHTIDALSILSPAAFVLYMYYALADDESAYPFSRAEFCELTNWTDNTYVEAHNELVAKHYITSFDSSPNILCFHDCVDYPPYMLHVTPEPDDDEAW